MGYTHYICIYQEQIGEKQWSEFVKAVRILIRSFEAKYQIHVLNGNQEQNAIVNETYISLNFDDRHGGYESIYIQKQKEFFENEFRRFNFTKTYYDDSLYDKFVRMVFYIAKCIFGAHISSDGGLDVFDEIIDDLYDLNKYFQKRIFN